MAVALMAGASFGDDGQGDDNNDNADGAVKRLKKVNLNRDTTNPQDVYSWFEITIQNIDVPGQSWDASVEVHIFWQDYGFVEIFKDYGTEEFMIDDDEVPVKLSEIFENKKQENRQNLVYKFLPETSTLYMMFTVSAQFIERMELNRFPLDRQFLNMEFNSWTSEGNWHWIVTPPDWVPEKYRQPCAVRMVSSITEYRLLSPYVDFSSKEPPFKIRLRVERLCEFYFGSIVLPNFVIVLACFGIFPIDVYNAPGRLSISVNLMLAAVAFRFVVQQMLPKVSYLTLMDYYLLAGFGTLTLIIGENGICAITSIPHHLSYIIDSIFLGVVCGLWLLIHFLTMIVYFDRNFLRLSWEEMDRLDSMEDEGKKFINAEKMEGRPQSIECITQWRDEYKSKTPGERADYYRKSHVNAPVENNE